MVEILPKVHQIDGVNPYSYVLVEDDRWPTLVDTGISKDGKKILELRSNKNVSMIRMQTICRE